MARFVAVMAVVSLPVSVMAQFPVAQGGPSTRPIQVSFGGGMSVPTGDWKSALKSGFNGQGSVIFNLGGFPLSFRADLNYNRFSFKRDAALTLPGTGTGTPNVSPEDMTQQLLGGLANISVPLLRGPVRPYVMAGLGAFNIKTKFSGSSAGDATGSDTKFAVNGGAGIQLRLMGAMLFLEGKVNNVYTEKGLIDTKSIQFVPVTFGFIF